ncbi:MAG: S8 family serine peptidase [Verrucomicrobiota bacterium]
MKSHRRLRRFVSCVVFAAGLFAFVCAAPGAPRRVRVDDLQTARQLLDAGGRLLVDYGSFQLIEVDSLPVAKSADARIRSMDGSDYLQLNARILNTRAAEAQALRGPVGSFEGLRLHLVQFVGPILPEWRAAIAAAGVQVINYLPQNAFLVSGDAAALVRLQSWAASNPVVQWEGPFPADYKVHPAASPLDAKGAVRQSGPVTVAVQLVQDPGANPATLALLDQWKLAPVKRDGKILQFRNLVVTLPAERVLELAARPDVISIQPWKAPRKMDERQDQIVAGNVAGGQLTGAGYLAWLAAKGFNQAQFDASGFVVDVSDSGIDNGTQSPGHYALYPAAAVTLPSRVVYNRLEGVRNSGSTLQGCDGHGNINAHIIAGYDAFTGFPHADSSGYAYGLGVCPFVRVGSSVVFDPDYFTSPNYTTLMTDAWNDGARVSNNSWGSSVAGAYDIDAQSYDALVRDSGAAGSNRAMVIVFSAGNDGPDSTTIASPGSAKNVITVGAADNVRSINTFNGGNDPSGSDACSTTDSDAATAESLADFSSRGPCADGRKKPDLVAPGTHVTGGAPQNGSATTNGVGSGLACFNASGVCALPGSGTKGNAANFFPLNQKFYTESSGTSHSAPAVSGACALLRQYFINQGWAPPSPAMTKAFLMNSARYLTGNYANDTLWSTSQGMGELNLGMAFDAAARSLHDQSAGEVFTATGQTLTFNGVISDVTKPFRVTLAWTDGPGSTLAGKELVNDLDLRVTVGGQTYKGNVFSGNRSVTGGSADSLNNVESVFLPAGASGQFSITVSAANIATDAIHNSGGLPAQDFALVIYNGSEAARPSLAVAAWQVLDETCATDSGTVDPGETVTVNFTLQNFGNANTTNLVLTLLATNGIASPSGPQSFGAVSTNGTTVSQAFSFTAGGTCGGTIRPTFQLQDGSADLGTLSCVIPLGASVPIYLQNFDAVTKGLPVGWTTAGGAGQKPWAITRTASDSPTSSIFSGESSAQGVNSLVSPAIPLMTGPIQLMFRNNFNLEGGLDGNGQDGGVLEVSVDGASFTDIVSAGGIFVSGGYTMPISSGYGNPLAGRQAWSGNSSGWINTIVDLPASMWGHTVQFRWRCGTDSGTAWKGWWIDSIQVRGSWCCPSLPPPAPFLPTAGGFAGLFSPAAGPDLGDSGFVSISLTPAASFSGSLQLCATAYKLSGQFDAFGAASNSILRKNASPLTLRMQVETDDNSRVTGTVSDGTWHADLLALRTPYDARTNPAPFAGAYTWIVQGTHDASNTNLPTGDGYAALKIDGSGAVKLAGNLADGLKLSESARIASSGQWPFYAAPSATEQLYGWLTLDTNQVGSDISGTLTWSKLAVAGARYFPLGFSYAAPVAGSAYRAPASGGQVMSYTNAAVILSGGNLAADIVNPVTLSGGKAVSGTPTNKLALSITTSSGAFKGTFVPPGATKSSAYAGVILQKQQYGAGYFPGTNQAGGVIVTNY